MCSDKAPLTHIHAFIVRIWQEGLTRPDGRILWRGRVQHAASGQSLAFQSPGELWHFIASKAGGLPEEKDDDSAARDRPPDRTGNLEKGGRPKRLNPKKRSEAQTQGPFDDPGLNQRRK